MTYKEQITFLKRALDNPDAGKSALRAVEQFVEEFDDCFNDNMPDAQDAQLLYRAIIGNYLREVAFDSCRDK